MTSTSWRARILGEPLNAADERAFVEHITDVNRRRIRVLLPLMFAMHVVHIVMFSTSVAQAPDTPAHVVMWRDAIIAIHAWTAGPVILLGAAVWFVRHAVARFFAPLAGLLYLVHAAAIVGADQLTLTNMTVFMGYSFGLAVVIVMSPLQAALMYGVGLASAFAAMFMMQPDAALRTGQLSSSSTGVMVSLVMMSLLYLARRRDFAQKLTIERQQSELTSLNESLEKRVEERVAEVERLNAALQAQVRERSSELSFALARLATHRGVDGALKAGTLLAERFEIQAQLGEGGMGTVYSALDKTTSTRVALKVIHASSARQVSVLHRFLDEARVVAALNHPAIVRMIHVDVSAEGLLFQAQELVEGETLEHQLTSTGPLPPAHAARIAAVLADALAFAHGRNVVHRDVKPANVMLTTTSPGLKLLDFGIAKLTAHTREGEARNATGVGLVIGTPAYMAPEQLEGQPSTSSVDAYALGVVLHRMLAGTLPSREPDTIAPPGTETKEMPAESKAMPAELTRVVDKCLSVEAKARPTLAELRDTLASFADAQGAPSLDAIVRGPAGAPGNADTVSMAKRRPGSSSSSGSGEAARAKTPVTPSAE